MELGGDQVVIVWRILISIVFLSVGSLLMFLYNAFVVKPRDIYAKVREQGIDGPPPRVLLGNMLEIKASMDADKKKKTSQQQQQPSSDHHEWHAPLFPFLHKWISQYGDLFTFSIATTQVISISTPELVKEMSTTTSLDLGKPSNLQKDLGPLLGNGVVSSNGADWEHQRKIIAPELYKVKVNGMMEVVSDAALAVVHSWMQHFDNQDPDWVAEIEICKDLKTFSGDVISKVGFGISHSDGHGDIFVKIRLLAEAVFQRVESSIHQIPGLRHFPTKKNREIWSLEKEIDALILKVAKDRKGKARKQDMLQMILDSADSISEKEVIKDQFIVDNCKTIYLAGYETTAIVASWCLMFLGSYTEWQSLVRDEVLQVFGTRVPDSDMIREMGLLTMVIHETLRLFPPVPLLPREALKDIKVGHINIPKGVNVWTVVAHMHTDPEIWGPDASQFNPRRFTNGIAGACKYPYTYLPFGFGNRVCLGQHLAMAELKMLISLLLTKFSFSLSPSYVHSPVMRLIVEPQHGVNLLVKKL